MGILDQLLGMRSWFLKNEDTGQELQGQFEPQGLTENIRQKYAKHGALNRAHPIIQFLSGDVESVTFSARLFARDTLFSSVTDDLELLKAWGRRDDALERPPIMSFWVGDGHLEIASCVVESLGGIAYGRPTILGGIKDVTLNITLLKYVPFDLEATDGGETRYHRARVRDYYEMLTYREYGSALIGDVIRKRHPTKPVIETADVIKLPSMPVLRKERVQTTSIPLQNSYSRKPSPQRSLRLYMFEQRDRTYTSHIVIE